MKDQLQHWNNAHSKQWLHAHSLQQTGFAEEVNAAILKHTAILELGCGEGNDAAYFAAEGHKVIATDFSDVVIKQNRTRWPSTNLQFEVQDTSKQLHYANDSFDVVYARLSLHYFTNVVTQDIFAEIRRVLKAKGYLYFMCKEVSDAIYGQGTKLEPDMFELEGHVRHFFSEAYVRDILAKSNLQIESIVKGHDKLYDRQSAFITVVARK